MREEVGRGRRWDEGGGGTREEVEVRYEEGRRVRGEMKEGVNL